MSDYLKSFIKEKIQSISVFSVLNQSDEIKKEIQNITDLIFIEAQETFLNIDMSNKNNLIINDKIDSLEKFNILIKKISEYIIVQGKCSIFLNRLKDMNEYLQEMKKDDDIGTFFSNDDDFSKQINLVTEYNEMNDQQLNYHNRIYNELQTNTINFSITILFNYDLDIWLNQRIDLNKDFYGYYQTCGGKLESNETYEECAIRETKEEAGIDIIKKDLIFVCFDSYFSTYSNKIFKCGIFIYYVADQIPINNEPEKHSNWFKSNIDTIKQYKLTDSLLTHYDTIKQVLMEYKSKNLFVQQSKNSIDTKSKELKKTIYKRKNQNNNNQNEIQSKNIIDNNNLKRKRANEDNNSKQLKKKITPIIISNETNTNNNLTDQQQSIIINKQDETLEAQEELTRLDFSSI